jgi:hypothetical protein
VLFFEFLLGSKSVEICRFLVSSWSLPHIGVVCLEKLYNLRFICLVSHSTGAPYFLTQETVIWILMGRTLLIRVRELVSSDIFLGRIEVSLVVWKLKSVFLRMRLKVDLF